MYRPPIRDLTIVELHTYHSLTVDANCLCGTRSSNCQDLDCHLSPSPQKSQLYSFNSLSWKTVCRPEPNCSGSHNTECALQNLRCRILGGRCSKPGEAPPAKAAPRRLISGPRCKPRSCGTGQGFVSVSSSLTSKHGNTSNTHSCNLILKCNKASCKSATLYKGPA